MHLQICSYAYLTNSYWVKIGLYIAGFIETSDQITAKSRTNLHSNGKYSARRSWHWCFPYSPHLDLGFNIRDHPFEGLWADQTRSGSGVSRGSHHHTGIGVLPPDIGNHPSIPRGGDRGSAVYRPLRAALCGQRVLPGSPLHAVALSPPGACLRQAPPDPLELAPPSPH